LLGPILVALFRCPLSLLPVALVCFLLLLGKLALALELLKPRFEAGTRVKVLQGPLQDQIWLLAAFASARACVGIAAAAGRAAKGRARTERDRGDLSSGR
jgi:hypothetical protein